MTLPAMLFAAGFGTRMGALTQDRPKPLIPVAGRPLIDHALDLLTDVKADPIVVNTHYLSHMIDAHISDRPIRTVHETPDILETGGGLRHALPALGGDVVITLNPDVIWRGPNPVRLLLDHWAPERMDALLMCVPVDHARAYTGDGDFTLGPHGKITRGPGAVYGGAQIIKVDRLHDIAEPAFSLNIVWDAMHRDGTLFGMRYPGEWCDVGRPDGIATAEAMVRDV